MAARSEGRRAPDRRAVAVADRGPTVSVRAETAYPVSVPSARVRVAAFAQHLRAHGVELHYRPNLTDAEYRAISSDAGPVRKASELSRASGRLLAGHLRRTEEGPLLVHRLRFLIPVPGLEPARSLDAYDFDDALYLALNARSSGGSILRSNRGFGWLKREAERWLSYVQRARVVIAGNAHLADRAKQYARRVEIIPSCIDPTRHPTREHLDGEVVTIGWIGSSSTTDDFRQVLPAIERLIERNCRLRLVLIGAESLGLHEPWLEQRPWSPTTEADELSQFDIGIMPMPDTEWTRGKCGYKLLQYFAAGLPVVASPVGVNTALVGNDERGLLARTPSEWAVGLEQLAGDHQARQAMGSAARKFVEDEFSYQRWAPEFASLLAEL